MLSVGRELNIDKDHVSCKACRWDGTGTELSNGLVPVTSTPAFLYVYTCPACGSVEVARKGKLLQFRGRGTATKEDEEPAPVKSGGATG